MTKRRPGLGGREASAEIDRHLAAIADRLNCPIHSVSHFRVSQIIEHHGRSRDGADWIGDLFPCFVRGAPVYRFEERDTARVKIGGGGHAQPALERGSEIREDVAEHIISHNYLVLPRIENHQHGHRVYVLGASFNLRVLGSHQFEDSPPKLMSIGQNVRLVGQSNPLSSMLTGITEGRANDPFDSMSGIDLLLNRQFLIGAPFEVPARVDIDSLSVLTKDDKIDVLTVAILER